MVYIGETKHHMEVRAAEHLHISAEKPSAVAKHIIDCESCFSANEQWNLSFKDFVILTKCKAAYDTKIKEAILIQNGKPTINKQLFYLH